MAGDASRLNGLKGGRKKGLATIEREKAKEYIAEQIGKYMPELFSVMLAKALDGDTQMIKELFDRAFGKALQSTDVTSKGERVSVAIMEEEFAKIINGYTKNKSRGKESGDATNIQ